MKYFLLHGDPRYTDSPQLIDWAQKIDVRDICPERSRRIPKRQILAVRSSPHTVYSSVISSPFLLLSESCMEAVRIYEPRMKAKQILLMDYETSNCGAYYLPILKRISCLAEGSVWNIDKSILQKGVLDLERVGNRSIFQLAELKNIYTVVRLDVLESILRRDARGIGITPLETVKGANNDDEWTGQLPFC